MKNKNLNKLFHPKSVAVIGASSNQEKVGYIVLRNIIDSGFDGEVFAVNKNGGKIMGLPAYESISDIKVDIDLVVIATPASTVFEILEEIVKLGIENLVVFSAGFGETGKEGKVLESKILKIVNENNINLLGPNCLGFVNNLYPINVTFGQLMNRRGNFLLLSQSGAIASSIFDWCEATDVGMASAVTLGNKIDINENDVLTYWKNTKKDIIRYRKGMSHVMPIGMYLESITEGRKFAELVSVLKKEHPIFILKPGKSEAAKTAMKSHTGAIAGEDKVLQAALAESGAIRCEGIEDFLDLTKAFSWEDAPKNNRIAVISNAGGPAVITADVISKYGMKMAKLSPSTIEVLKKNLPRFSNFMNPIDVLGDALADRYKVALEQVLKEEEVDGVMIILTPQVMTQIEETAEVIGKLSYIYKKPILCSFIGGTRVAMGEKVLNKYKIPSFRYPERAIYAFSKMYEWQKNRDISLKTGFINRNQEELNTKSYGNILKNLKKYHIQTPAMVRVSSFGQAEEFFRRKEKVVLKILSEKLVHKKEFGAVITGIDSIVSLKSNWSVILQNNLKIKKKLGIGGEIYIQEQVESGIEMIIGAKTDISFGKVLMIGAGGETAELSDDNKMLLLPTTEKKIQEMILSLKLYPLLNGFRGRKVLDVSSLTKTIFNFSAMVEQIPNIVEAEVNPLIVNSKGSWAVDVKVLTNDDS